MIISASRRTDIPAYYSEWFVNRIHDGFVYVRNPMNIHQISKISLSRDVVDAIVFWTKNPVPMMDKIDEFKEYPYYFQFTLTSYGKDIEDYLQKIRFLYLLFVTCQKKLGVKELYGDMIPFLSMILILLNTIRNILRH